MEEAKGLGQRRPQGRGREEFAALGMPLRESFPWLLVLPVVRMRLIEAFVDAVVDWLRFPASHRDRQKDFVGRAVGTIRQGRKLPRSLHCEAVSEGQDS